MAVGRSVQFRGINNVVGAYERQDLVPWGIFQGTQFMQGYNGSDQKEGSEMLEQYLQALDSRSADGVTYTLCVYDGLAKGEKVRSQTKYDASFNFRLIDNIDGSTSGRSYYEQKISGLEKQIEDMKEPAELTPKEKLLEHLGTLFSHPQVQQMLATKLVTIVEGLTAGITGLFNPGGVVPRPTSAAIGAVDVNAENEKLQRAVQMLIQVDDQLGTHLLKLAEVAAADPAKYQNLISMLNLL